nr:transposase [Alicyclobacillus montanus]
MVAFTGVDTSVFSSGKFTATINRITKSGSNRLRYSLFVAVLCSLRKSDSQRLKAFYDRKREKGKPHKVAVIACVNKLLHYVDVMSRHLVTIHFLEPFYALKR